jgi:hypothetical protein
MSSGPIITIVGAVPQNQYQHRYRARFDNSYLDILIPIVPSLPYTSSIMLFQDGEKLPQEGNYVVDLVYAVGPDPTGVRVWDNSSKPPTEHTYEIIVFFSDGTLDGQGAVGTSRLDVIDESYYGTATNSITFTSTIGTANFKVLINGIDNSSWTRVGGVFTFTWAIKTTDVVTLRIYNIV